MTDEQPGWDALRHGDPADMSRIFGQDNLQLLANVVSPYLSADTKTLAYVFPLASRLGHLALEPHALANLYGTDFQRIVMVTRENRTFPPSRGLLELAGQYVHFADSPYDSVMEMGHHDGNLQDFGIFSFAISSPQTLFADFVDRMRRGVRPVPFAPPPAMVERGDAFLRGLGVDQSDRIVALHVRTDGTYAAARYHNYRNADLANYAPLIRHLLAEGYWVIRLGDAGSLDLPLNHARLIDLPKLDRYEDYLDVAVVARADFAVMCASGPEAICRVLGTPMLRANSVVEHHVWLNPGDLLLLKTYHCRRRGRALSYRELLFEGLSTVESVEDLDRRDVQLVENSPDDLLAAGTEMIDRLAGRILDDAQLQNRFREIGTAFEAAYGGWPPERRLKGAPRLSCYGYALPWTRYAASYCLAHPEFLSE